MAASIALATREGAVTVLVPEDEMELAEKTSLASLVPYKPAGLKTLKSSITLVSDSLGAMLKSAGLERAKLGLQLGQGVQPASYAVMNEYRSSLPKLLGELLPNATLEPCDELFEEMEAVKTNRELGLSAHACAVTSAGFASPSWMSQPSASLPLI